MPALVSKWATVVLTRTAPQPEHNRRREKFLPIPGLLRPSLVGIAAAYTIHHPVTAIQVVTAAAAIAIALLLLFPGHNRVRCQLMCKNKVHMDPDEVSTKDSSIGLHLLCPDMVKTKNSP